MVVRSRISVIVAVVLAWFSCIAAAANANQPIRALIVDGRNNHDWRTTTPMLKQILEHTDHFEVTVATVGGDVSGFAPQFWDFDVVVLNYNGDPWPAPTRQTFTEYVAGGGGVVVVHAANNSFPEWRDYNRIIGLGGWGGRNDLHGPYVYYNEDNELVRDYRPGGGGGHGPLKEFVIRSRDSEHPIMRGLPEQWLHTADELYDSLRGPGERMTILATAWTDRTRRHEPQLMTIDYYDGKVFHTTLGHDHRGLMGLGFQVTLQRGAEWAATGQVTIPAPDPEVLPLEGEPGSRDLFSNRQSDTPGWGLRASHGTFDLANAIDGRAHTRWTTGTPQRPGQWISIDLEEEHEVKSLTLDTEASPLDYPRRYVFRISDDGQAWSEPIRQGEGDGSLTRIELPAGTMTRYLRIEQSGESERFFWSIHDLRIETGE